MKFAIILAAALALYVAASAGEPKSQDLTTATAVTITDFRSSTNGLVPDITITNAATVAALVRAIQSAPGKWKKGSFTVPAGYKRFTFLHDSQFFAGIGLGEQFLVRGSGGHWEYKDITKELEAKINALAQEGAPNQHLQPTPR